MTNLTYPKPVLPSGVHLAGAPQDAHGFEGAPAALMDRITAFLTGERSRLRGALHDRDAATEQQELRVRPPPDVFQCF